MADAALGMGAAFGVGGGGRILSDCVRRMADTVFLKKPWIVSFGSYIRLFGRIRKNRGEKGLLRQKC
jgi:hypothetical protein